MARTLQLYVRTGIVGAWAVMLGFAVVIGVKRALSVLEPTTTRNPALTAAGFPVAGFVTALFTGLYNGGSMSMALGGLLVLVGWAQLVRLA
ncbi:MAG: hypothetical protein ABEI31_09040 [Halodesulfurarchaeum sp.]